MKFNLISKITVATILLITNPVINQARASNLTYQRIEQNKAIQGINKIEVVPGRISSIDFSATQETIIYLGIGDASRLVFNTDFPLEQGLAKTIFLRPIQPLKFAGATTNLLTNLVIKTIDLQGQQRLYNFQVVHSPKTTNYLGISIIPSRENQDQIAIGQGRIASLDDVEIGLKLAISKGYTLPEDLVVDQVRQFLAIVRNQNLTIPEAAQQVNLELQVIVELAKIA
jgi:putative lipoic acid-binding regulatory protein